MNSVSFSLTLASQLEDTAPFLYGGPFDQGILYAHSLGYDCVEIHTARPEELPVEDIDAALSDTGIRISALGTGRVYAEEGLSLIDPSPRKRGEAVARLKSFITLASRFGCLVIIGCIRGNLSGQSQKSFSLQLLSESMAELDRYAAEQEVLLVMEPINRYENNFLCSTDEVADFIHKNACTNVKLMVDTFHMNIEEKDILDSLAKHYRDIYYIHFADSNRSWPGQGHIDFKKIVAFLKDCNYNKTISAECQYYPDAGITASHWLSAVKELYKENEC